jgi:DNA-directed RNA polymerase specialized sigma24 family protein
MTDEPGNTAGQNTMHTLAGPSDFPTTRWTLVVAAANPQRKEARSALVSLCEGYWYPLYAYVRRRGYPADQAQDLTQDFFIRLLEGRYLDRAQPEKGRFRAFLLTSMKFFLADEADRDRAQKRGGGERPVPGNLVRRRALSARACAQRDAGADLRTALGPVRARQSHGQTPVRVCTTWPH